jgi:hypothetical protein
MTLGVELWVLGFKIEYGLLQRRVVVQVFVQTGSHQINKVVSVKALLRFF